MAEIVHVKSGVPPSVVSICVEGLLVGEGFRQAKHGLKILFGSDMICINKILQTILTVNVNILME